MAPHDVGDRYTVFQKSKPRRTWIYKIIQQSTVGEGHGHSTTVIADSGCPQLRSAHANVLTVPRTNTWLGDRSFSVAGPRIWNSLYPSLQQPDIEFGHFKRLLKVFLFDETAAHKWHFDFNEPCISQFTYLLTHSTVRPADIKFKKPDKYVKRVTISSITSKAATRLWDESRKTLHNSRLDKAEKEKTNRAHLP